MLLKKIKSLQLVHRAMLLGQLLLMVIAIVVNRMGKIATVTEMRDRELQVLALIVGVVSMYLVFYPLAGIAVRAAAVDGDLSQRFERYARALIIRWAVLELAALFSATCFLWTSNFSFLGIFIILFVSFGRLQPQRRQIMKDLGVSEAS